MRKEPRELTPAEAVALCLERTENGKVANTMANYKRVLQSDPLLKGAICKNLLTGQVDVVRPLGWYRESSTLSDVDIKYLLMYFEETYGWSRWRPKSWRPARLCATGRTSAASCRRLGITS